MSDEKLSTSLGNHFETIVILEDYMSVICGHFNINHHTVSSKLKTLQDALLFFDLHYAENANCTRETKTSCPRIDAVYSNVKIDLKVSPTTISEQYTLFFGFSEPKLSHLEKEIDDDRMIKMWTKHNDANAIINLQFYMQHELQKFELTLDQLSCEEAMKHFQFLLNKCVEKFVSTKIFKGTKKIKKCGLTKKRQQYPSFIRTKDKNDQLKLQRKIGSIKNQLINSYYFSSVGKILASNFESKKENVSKSSSISVQPMRLNSATLLEVREIINKMQTKYSTDCFELNNFF